MAQFITAHGAIYRPWRNLLPPMAQFITAYGAI
jgi:hypothetical protein